VVRKPTREEVLAAKGRTLPDVIGPGLRVLFCGINPGLYSAAVGHHFARPGNRFWRVIYLAGFTARLLSPFEDYSLLERGVGLTNLVERATATAKELSREELIEGRKRLEEKAEQYQPKIVAILGIVAYRKAFGYRKVAVGAQAVRASGSRLWVLPNPSGINAHYQLKDLAELYGELRIVAGV